MSTLTNAVASADQRRKSLRNKKRAAFFADLGLEVINDPFSLELDSKAQHAVVLHLLDQSIETHMDETSALRALRKEVAALSIGIPNGVVSQEGRPVPAVMKPQSWQFGIFGTGPR